ncbi:MAG: Ppx/GppA family phosphatase [Fimbriimonadaceae bacterium]
MRRAVVDVGSNSVLLVVAELSEDGRWRAVYESSEVTGLGEGTKATGLLGEEGMARTLAALRSCFAMARELGSEPPTAAATMAARIARNAEEFLRRAREQGTPVIVLSGEDEAELGFRAVADDPLFASEPRLSIVDPGGQSTEIVVAERGPEGHRPVYRRSFPVGTLGLRSGPIPSPAPPIPERLAAMEEVDRQFESGAVPPAEGLCVVLGATGTNLITMRERMEVWQPERVHGAWLEYEEVSRWFERLCDLDDEGRAALPGLERGRERSIHLGALILERALFALRVARCRVSVRGWRHALLERGLTD